MGAAPCLRVWSSFHGVRRRRTVGATRLSCGGAAAAWSEERHSTCWARANRHSARRNAPRRVRTRRATPRTRRDAFGLGARHRDRHHSTRDRAASASDRAAPRRRVETRHGPRQRRAPRARGHSPGGRRVSSPRELRAAPAASQSAGDGAARPHAQQRKAALPVAPRGPERDAAARVVDRSRKGRRRVPRRVRRRVGRLPLPASLEGRGDAAAATRTCRGDRIAAPPRPGRGDAARESRAAASAGRGRNSGTTAQATSCGRRCTAAVRPLASTRR